MFSSSFRRFIVLSSGAAAAVGGAFLIKDKLGGANFPEDINLEGKVAIITGANSGIGLTVAKDLAKRGAKLILACRDKDKCETARETVVMDSYNKYVYCRYCDLSSQESIVRFARRINNEYEKIDLLINNAGIMGCPKEMTNEGIEMQLGVNHMGHFLLTNLLLDKLKAAAPSRIVNVTSVAYRHGHINVDDLNSERAYNPDMAYNQSCLANVLFTRELAKRLEGTGVTVNAINPGVADTNITRHKGSGWYVTSWLVYPFVWPFVKSPRQAAQPVLHVALSQTETVKQATGKYFGSHREPEEFEGEALRDDLSKWLWQVDEKWTHLDEALAESKRPIKATPAQKASEAEKKIETATSTLTPAG